MRYHRATLIGTPPNIIIAGIREDKLGAPFAMFDFAPVGLVVATVGLAASLAAHAHLVLTKMELLGRYANVVGLLAAGVLVAWIGLILGS